jgi:hypothetical protein
MRPSSGRVLFEGRDVTGLPPHELYRLGILRTFQIPKEFGRLTVLENLMAAAPDQPGEEIFLNWLRPARVRARDPGHASRSQVPGVRSGLPSQNIVPLALRVYTSHTMLGRSAHRKRRRRHPSAPISTPDNPPSVSS